MVILLTSCCRNSESHLFYSGSFGNLFKTHRFTHVVLILEHIKNRLVCAFCYYGIVLMSTGLFESSNNNRTCSSNLDSGIFKTVQSCTAESHYLTTRDYIDLLWTTLAEFPGNNNSLKIK